MTDNEKVPHPLRERNPKASDNEKARALPAKWRERAKRNREVALRYGTGDSRVDRHHGIADAADDCADELQAALAEQPAGGGVEAPIGYSLRFGMGAFIVNTGTHEGEPAVFVDDAPAPGEVGGKAPEVPAETTPRLRLLFPTKEQAKAVADALVNAIPSLPLRDAADMLDPAKQAGVLRRVVDTLPPPARVDDAAVERALVVLQDRCALDPEASMHDESVRAALEAALQAARPSEPVQCNNAPQVYDPDLKVAITDKGVSPVADVYDAMGDRPKENT